MSANFSNWLNDVFKAADAKQKKSKRRPSTIRRLDCEQLEDRVVPANFTITGANLSIQLNVNESLTVTDTGANTTFTIDNGNFVQVGGDLPVSGGGTQVLVVTDAQFRGHRELDKQHFLRRRR